MINTKEYNYNSNINITEIPVKVYKYCIKCTKNLPEGSESPFCDDFCRNEYYAEIRADLDDIITDL